MFVVAGPCALSYLTQTIEKSSIMLDLRAKRRSESRS